MRNSLCALVLLAFMMALFVGAPLAADDKKPDKKNSHTGLFVSAKGEREFTMKDKEGKDHTHTLAPDAKVLDLEGKDCKLTDFKEGQRIRVTTKEDDKKVATKVWAVKPKKDK